MSKEARDITSNVQFPGGRWAPGGGSSPGQASWARSAEGLEAGQREPASILNCTESRKAQTRKFMHQPRPAGSTALTDN